MANVGKKDGGEQKAMQQTPQGQPQAGQQQAGQQQGQPQRGELTRREQGQQLMRDPLQMLLRDPFRVMRDMLTDPFRALSQGPWAAVAQNENWIPRFDIRETDDAFVFKADMPGMRPDDLEIVIDGDRLIVSGRRVEEREEGEGRYHAVERSFGTFTRTFLLPDGADTDNIRSELKNGELTLVVPKKAGAAQRRKIQVGSGGQKS